MRDLDKALADILAIRNQIAAGTAFRAYGPAAVAATAGLAALTTGLQLVFLERRRRDARPVRRRLACDRAACGCHHRRRDARAFASPSLRPRRCHDLSGGRADAAVGHRRRRSRRRDVAVRPRDAVDAAGTVAAVDGPCGVCVGAFAAVARCGLAAPGISSRALRVLMFASRTHALSPLLMGAPFVIGQSLMAAILYFASGDCRCRRLTPRRSPMTASTA